MQHHAYVVTGEQEKAIADATEFLVHEYGIEQNANPDFVVQRYKLFSVEDARSLFSLASLASVTGQTKVLVIAAARIYSQAQNALLKLLEEPPVGTVIVLCVPNAEMLLSTVRSRVMPLPVLNVSHTTSDDGEPFSEDAQIFLSATKEKRTAIIKKLVSGKDEDARRAGRDTAIRIVDGLERAVYRTLQKGEHPEKREALLRVLSDIETLRGYLYDRAAPVRMILEHISIVLPKL